MAKMNDLLSNPEFLKKVESTSSVEEAIELFRDEGLEVSESELRTIFTAPVEDESGELSEESLESVTGGVSVWRFFKPILPIKPIWNTGKQKSSGGGGKGALGGGKIGSR